jgi:hypothetical protein
MSLPLSLPKCLDTAVAHPNQSKPSSQKQMENFAIQNGRFAGVAVPAAPSRYHSCSQLHGHKRYFEPPYVVALFEPYSLIASSTKVLSLAVLWFGGI